MILRLLTTSFRSSAFPLSPKNVLASLRTASKPTTPAAVRFSFSANNFSTGSRLASNPANPARVYDVNTKVAKDVMLYKYENPRFYRILNMFAISQFLFWGYLSHFAYTTLRDAPVQEEKREELAWWEKINLGENKYRNGIAIMSFVIGYGILFTSWMFTLRSVRFLILRKGGEKVSVVTYGPFGKNRIMEVPLKCISAQESREAARVTIPIKIQNRSFFYVIDKKGEFTNGRLYDYTVGMRRNLK